MLRNLGMFIAGGAAVAVLSSGVAVAANGSPIVIGQSNSGAAKTTLSNSNGTALALNSKSGTAPLAVNRTTKVTNLNAEMVDGLGSGSFALAAGKTGVIVGNEEDADGLINTARCPSGTVATGGGGYAFDEGDYVYYSGPDMDEENDFIPNSWLAIADGGSMAWVVCYNPRGAVPGADLFAFSASGGLAAAATDGPQKHLR